MSSYDLYFFKNAINCYLPSYREENSCVIKGAYDSIGKVHNLSNHAKFSTPFKHINSFIELDPALKKFLH